MTIHILSTRELTPKQLASLHAIVPDAEIVHFWAKSGREIEQALTPATEVLFTGRGDYSLAHATGLRWVQMENAGIDHIHDTPLWHSSFPIASANGASAPSARICVDHAVGLGPPPARTAGLSGTGLLVPQPADP
ncbi:MAG: hypothetical protein R3E79_50055 [Caldilineaceae bacterium]